VGAPDECGKTLPMPACSHVEKLYRLGCHFRLNFPEGNPFVVTAAGLRRKIVVDYKWSISTIADDDTCAGFVARLSRLRD
jgi:hypothetical protein